MNNQWEAVVSALDRAIGGKIVSSNAKILRQNFDNGKKQWVALVEYRYVRDLTPTDGEYRPKKKQKTQKPPRAKTPSYRNRKQQNLKLLQAVNAMAKARGANLPLT